MKKTLVVDKDRSLCLLIKRKNSQYNDTFTTLTATDGLEAVGILSKNDISIVVANVQIPKMDGFTLLAHIKENYPDIPVIIMSADDEGDKKQQAMDLGAISYIKKPVIVEKLGQQIIAILDLQEAGGRIYNISLEAFSQLVELERSTCTIRAKNTATQDRGTLLFRTGELENARVANLQGPRAAYEIFSWDQVAYTIEMSCIAMKRQIHGGMQPILMEAMRLKDERMDSCCIPGENDRSYLSNLVRNTAGMRLLCKNETWAPLVEVAEKLGQKIAAGALRTTYINQGGSDNYIVLPGKENTIITVAPDSPRDQLLKVVLQ